jgi:hypothetical protein
MRKIGLVIIGSCLLLLSCSPGRHYSPARKFGRGSLEKDFGLLRKILESKHPSLYWYTPKDSMDIYFEEAFRKIEDSMTENRFTWQVMAPLMNKIRCGHTSVRASKGYEAWSAGKRLPSFPLLLRIWNDSMIVTGNLNKNDSLIKKGMLITSINGKTTKELLADMMGHLTTDSHADNINYIRLSSNFPYFHRNIYGLSDNYEVIYKDSSGLEKKSHVPLFKIPDSTWRSKARVGKALKKAPKLSRREKMEKIRSLKTDSTGQLAIMTINSFLKGHLRGFFRRSFHDLKKNQVSNLIIDLRINGGGRISTSTLLARYISRKHFRLADSAYTATQSLRPYSRYIKGGVINDIAIYFISSRKKDGYRHMYQMEKKKIRPKQNRHYDHRVFILTNGPTFSASTLFCNIVKGQPGILLAGEETGGGWYGNNGILIPDITLPETKIRVRLPLFRIVQYNHVPKTSNGIIPDIKISPSYEALMKGVDRKIETVKQMIYAELKEKNQIPIRN